MLSKAIQKELLPARYFFYELETDLSLSNPSCPPEETRVPRYEFTISTMNKNLPKHVKYIFLSSKQWTGVWFLRYTGLHLPFLGIEGETIDIVAIVLVGKIYTIIARLFGHWQGRHTKVPPVMSIFWQFTKKPDSEF